MTESRKRVVLITGCSSGIGKALAEAFRKKGYTVAATARRKESVDELAAAGYDAFMLDVVDETSIKKAVDQIRQKLSRIDVLVNNAGFGLMGPTAEVSVSDLRRQLEVNVVGQIAVTQAVIPAMIEQKEGRIVNMGSISGIQATPFSGAYCASKAALHALSDSLRMELAPFGIKVIIVQPGAIESEFGNNAKVNMGELDVESSIYRDIIEMVQKRAEISQDSPMPTEKFAEMVVEQVIKADPPAVFRKGPHSLEATIADKLLPTFLKDKILTRKFGLNRIRR